MTLDLIAEARAAVLRAELAEATERARLAEKRLAKEDASHAQTCRLSDEWVAKLAEAKRLGMEAVQLADDAIADTGDCYVNHNSADAIRAALEAL